MRRRALTIGMAFAPTRLSSLHLRTAYAIVLPEAERAVRSNADGGTECERSADAKAKPEQARSARRGP
jgi:hypothetical protein